MSRKTVLVLSGIISLLVHGGFIATAPNVVLVGRTPPAEFLPKRLNVKLIEDVSPQFAEEATNGEAGNLATRPGSIRDLLTANQDPITPADALLDKPAEVPKLAQRLGSDILPPPPADIPQSDLEQLVDAKIMEISEADARQNIAITRRLVAPSSNRILRDDENPVLRGTGPGVGDEVVMIDPLAFGKNGSGDAAGGTAPNSSSASQPQMIASSTRPAQENSSGSSITKALDVLPELPIEHIMARAPVVQAIEKQKKYDFIDDLVGMTLETYIPPGEREGFFRLRVAPKEGGIIEPLPKDVTFIIDASNSILQRKLDQTVLGVQQSIAGLREQDRFNVIIFRDTPTLFQSNPVYATDDVKKEAVKFLKGQQARGETDVYEGIRPVIDEAPRVGIPGIVMVITDGKPTAGIRDGRTIINTLTDENKDRFSIYAFGGGRNVNQHLLDLLAYRNKGESKIAPQIEEMGKAFPEFFSRLNDPILVNCEADFGRINDANIFPKQIPDFFRGQAVTIYGKFDPAKDRQFAMRLTGQAGPRQKEVVFRAELNQAAKGDVDIARNWAFRKIYYLIGEATRVGDKPELLAEIQSLARQYNIRTSYDE